MLIASAIIIIALHSIRTHALSIVELRIALLEHTMLELAVATHPIVVSAMGLVTANYAANYDHTPSQAVVLRAWRHQGQLCLH